MRASRFILAGLALTATGTAQAQPIVVADSGDSAWVLAASILALLAALPGLALVHGRGRAGPTGMALFVSAAVVSLIFAIIGYTLAFGEGSTVLGGAGNALLANLADLRGDTTISEAVFALFEMIVAIFAVGILVSSLAERARPGWLIAFAGLWTLIVYVPLARWMWGGGWLAELGALDFGGGIVVQTSAGVAALIAAILLGRPRETEIAHDSRLAVAGVALLWVGWFGVLGGSMLAATDDTASVIINAQLAASAAILAGLAIERIRSGAISVYGATTAAIAGLAAISSGADVIGPGGAIASGVAGAVGAALASLLVERLKLGGSASAFVAHGGGGIAGALIFPLFVFERFGGVGFDEGNVVTQLVAQGIAVLVVAFWTAGITAVAALMVAMVLPMTKRHSEDPAEA